MNEIFQQVKEYQDDGATIRSASDVIRTLRIMNLDIDSVLSLRKEFNSFSAEFGMKPMTVAGWNTNVYRVFNNEDLEEILITIGLDDINNADLAKELISNIKAKQNLQTKNRVLNKITRNELFNYEGLDKTLSQITEILSAMAVDKPKGKIEQSRQKDNGKKYKMGIIAVSDIHLNELVLAIDGVDNTYSFDIAAKRLKQGIQESIRQCKAAGISDILFVMLGDLVNSNRRDDEKIHSESSRGVACLVGTWLMKGIIDDISKDFNVAVTYVSGNESRLDFDNNFSSISNTDNFDFLIYHQTKALYYEQNKRVRFIDSTDPKELYLVVNGFHLLAVHGENMKAKQIDRTMGKYAFNGKEVNLILSGHFHSVEMNDLHFRVGSVCGSNAYSAKALNFYSRASIGLVMVDENNGWSGMKIDIQDANNYDATYQIPDIFRKYFRTPTNVVAQENNTIEFKF